MALAARKDRIGRPSFAAAVQIKKNYVSYHLMGLYAVRHLANNMSPQLKERMQGKSCFNFRTIEAVQAKELSALTGTTFAALRTIELPWEKGERGRPRRSTPPTRA